MLSIKQLTIKNLRPHTNEIISHLIFWLLAILLSQVLDISTDTLNTSDLHPYKLLVSACFNVAIFYFNYWFLMPRYMGRRSGFYAMGLILLATIPAIIETLIDNSIIGNSLDLAFNDPLLSLLHINITTHGIFCLLSLLMRLRQDWFINQRVQQQIKAQHTQTELDLLKSQVHPHFLFNTLNTLYSSSYEYGDEQTANGIGKLSHLLRYMLYETKAEQVPLENEIDYLQDYIDLQTLRFGQEVTVTFTVNGDPDNITVAPMLFITLIENAFKHGISVAKHSTIVIQIDITLDKVVLSVENDIHRQRAKSVLEGHAGGLGLENLQRRLALLYPQRHQLFTIQENQRFKTHLELR
ncbi:MAG: two-component system LytT family sensor kinase [Alteromonadaceae bacterium]|jgi:two-component system LytT family sensor kinase